ncbi:DUF3152 domain-containing protein [Nocardioides jiangxiensis]|uniref:DUF3152 domain-containing protein n=1 Tax=Nocardioides jiangxiensis TaxID=3064524 RepID=A0ABT9AXW6_9ACTN|nr:DUF3152 domain-containing protein [Nocardioides sp. WY-20]MDO7867395.1 DUF3152 domain-containing protein [Nocardioides sp. WY-20]
MRRRRTVAGRRRAAPARRRTSRAMALLGLVVAHVGLLGALPALVASEDGREPGGAVAGLLAYPADAAVPDVRGGAVPTPGVRPVIAALGPEVPHRATGSFVTAPAPRAAPVGDAVTYRVEVERGLPYDAVGFARAVDRTLGDPRSWPARTGRPMARVDGAADLRIVLASPATTDRLCAPLTTEGQVSCRNGDDVVINALRWAQGAPSYGGDVAAYRIYVVNHEVGHGLGHGHARCTGRGDFAPVMLQQTLGLHGCRANPWPTEAEVG